MIDDGGSPARALFGDVMAGITFTPGHRLVADEDGVIVLPAGLHEATLQVADALAATSAYAAGGGR